MTKNDVEYVSKLYIKFCLNRLKNRFLMNIFLGLGFFFFVHVYNGICIVNTYTMYVHIYTL